MRDFNIGFKKEHLMIILVIVMMGCLFFGYYNVVSSKIQKNEYSSHIEKMAEQNKNTVFKNKSNSFA